MKKMTFTLAESGQKRHVIAQAAQRHERSERRATINGNVEFSLLLRAVPFNARRRMSLPVILNLFQDLSHAEISREISKDKLLLRRWPSFTSGQIPKQVRNDNKKITKNVKSCTKRKKGKLMFRKTQKLTTKAAFTLAETLIALAVIGIVAALTIPGLVKNYNQTAWTHAKTVFSRKLDVALKEMNTEGTLTGYRTTEEFVNELKKNIKITKVCTGSQITNCFADKVVWNADEDPIEVTTSSVQFTGTADSDWAEPVGIQFVNGVNAIIGYNKNCTSDPYNNQFATGSCIGIMYDVSGYKKPNAKDKDIATNGNVALNGCAFSFTYGEKTVCFTKIVPPGSYEALSYSECEKQKTALGLDYCYSGSYGDMFAGVAAVCGGKTEMAKTEQLTLLAKYLYETDDIDDIGQNDTPSYSSAFNANVVKTPFGDYYSSNSYFAVWAGAEYNSGYASYRVFNSSNTHYSSDHDRGSSDYVFAVCSGDQSFNNIVASPGTGN